MKHNGCENIFLELTGASANRTIESDNIPWSANCCPSNAVMESESTSNNILFILILLIYLELIKKLLELHWQLQQTIRHARPHLIRKYN